MRRHTFAPFVLVLSSAACSSEGELEPLDVCWMDAAPISPQPGELQVGDTVTLTARVGEPRDCLPPNLEPVSWRWTSNAPAVATVDSVRGLLTARAPGETWIRVRHARVPEVGSAVWVRVIDG